MECAIGKLVAGHLLLMEARLFPEVAVDVQEIVLASQLAADVECDRSHSDKFKSATVWWSHYEGAMLGTNWTIINDADYEKQPLDSAEFSVEGLIETYFLPRLTHAQGNEIRSLYKRMAGLAKTESVALQLCQHALKGADDGAGSSTFTFQVSVLESPVQLATLFLTFTTTEATGSNPFLQIFTGNCLTGSIEGHFSRRTWDADSYPAMRKSIRGFLNGRQHSLILPIPCEVPDDTGRL
ncbi:hypothetical protein PS3A_30700 [Pseudomonas sp. 3A(2025)]